MIPIIRVRDTDNGNSHIVGTDSHDELLLENDTGSIYYGNMQNLETSRKDLNNAYEFESVENADCVQSIEFVTLEEFVEIYTKIAKEQAQSEFDLQKAFTEAFGEMQKLKTLRQKPGYIRHT